MCSVLLYPIDLIPRTTKICDIVVTGERNVCRFCRYCGFDWIRNRLVPWWIAICQCQPRYTFIDPRQKYELYQET